MQKRASSSYQRSALRIVIALLFVWGLVSFGCGILFREWLDEHAPPVGHAPFGFWMAQQGAIIAFVLILALYAGLMGLLDEKHGYDESSRSEEDA